MCLSRIGQIAYGALALVTVAFISASMFTKGWHNFRYELKGTVDNLLKNGTLDLGLFAGFCSDSASQSGPAVGDPIDVCRAWFSELPAWRMVVIAAMVLALGLALLSFFWNLLTFCACCCHDTISKPLSGLAATTTVLLAIALISFYTNNDNIPDIRRDNISLTNVQQLYSFVRNLDQTGDHVGYSFYMACAAAIVSCANVFVGALIVCVANKGL